MHANKSQKGLMLPWDPLAKEHCPQVCRVQARRVSSTCFPRKRDLGMQRGLVDPLATSACQWWFRKGVVAKIPVKGRITDELGLIYAHATCIIWIISSFFPGSSWWLANLNLAWTTGGWKTLGFVGPYWEGNCYNAYINWKNVSKVWRKRIS